MIGHYILYYCMGLLPMTLYIMPRKNRKLVYSAVIIILCIFYCFSYMSGSDWRQYEVMYDSNTISEIQYGGLYEFLYRVLTLVLKTVSVDFWHFIIVTKVFCFASIVSFLKKHLLNVRHWGGALFILSPLALIFLFIDNPLRNLIAISIFLYSTKFINQRKIKQTFILMCIASFIHSSAFLAFPIAWFGLNMKIKSKSLIVIYLIYFIFSAYMMEGVVKDFLLNFVDNSFIGGKVDAYFIQDSVYSKGNAMTFGALDKLFIFAILMKARKKIEKIQHGTLLFNGAIIFLFLYRLGISIAIFNRFQYYFVFFYAAALCISIHSFSKQVKPFIITYVIGITFTLTFLTITSKPYFIPYSNYLNYLFKEKPSYYERSEYNIKKSPIKIK